MNVLDDREDRLVYTLVLRGIAILLQCFLIYMPTALINDALYKKNSNVFKTLITLMCITTCSLYFHYEALIDYQSIIFVGFLLWSQAFLITDSILMSVFAYGLAINCSIDCLMVWPFMFYRVTCKLMK